MDSILPAVYPLYKLPKESSKRVVSKFKKELPPKIKIGHFGTLDPFATGLLLVATGSATKLNNFVHDYLPKTYLAVGKLGKSTETGDYTGATKIVDESAYLKNVISEFDLPFLNDQLSKKFMGEYWQSPHTYSAAKYEGKPLHEWARKGVTIQKEQVKREIHQLEVVKYQFPYLTFKVTVSSGTYIRSLFEEIAFHLGTLGTLVALTRTDIGKVSFKEAMLEKDFSLKKSIPFERLLPFPVWQLEKKEAILFNNGVLLKAERGLLSGTGNHYFVKYENTYLGVATPYEDSLQLLVNFNNRL